MTQVIAADRTLGGFRGDWGPGTSGVRRKREMLEAEGCVFDDHGAVVQDGLFSPPPFEEADCVDCAPPAGPRVDACVASATGTMGEAELAKPRKRKER